MLLLHQHIIHTGLKGLDQLNQGPKKERNNMEMNNKPDHRELEKMTEGKNEKKISERK